MTDLKHYESWFANQFAGPSAAERETERRLASERSAAEAAMAYQFANLHMPDDIRERAKSWGMEAFCELLWNNAFQAGWRERQRAIVEARHD